MKRKSTRLNSVISPQSNIRKHLLRFSAILSLLILAVVFSANAAAQTYNFSILDLIGGTFSPIAKIADAPKTLNNQASSDSTVKDLMFGKTSVEPLNLAGPLVSSLVISEIYGSGGNGGAVLTNDFVELYNSGATSVNVSGYSIQYASSVGTTWSVTLLSRATDTVIEPGTYFLIQLASTAAVGTANPTPNATGTIDLSASSGKVALVSNTTALTGACPTGGAIVDFVGYGTANCSENVATTASANAPSPGAPQSLTRNATGTDTDDNSADFTVTTGSSPTGGPTPTAGGNGDLTISQSAPASVTPGSNFSYTLTVNNSGSNTNLTGVSVNFTLPTGVTFVNASGSCGSRTVVSGVVQFRNCTITANSTNFTVTVTAPATPQTITSNESGVVVDPTTTTPESNEANNTASTVTTTVTAPNTAAPVVNDPANGSLINTATPTYNGTAPANSTVTVFVDGVSIGTTTATNGFFSLTQPTALSQGSHTVYATAQTAGSTVSPNSNTNTFTVDSIAPNAPVVITPANGSTTNDDTPTYSGTAEPGSTVTIYLAEIPIGQVTADSSGNFSFTDQIPLSNATFMVRATATDAAGNVSLNSNTNTFTVDTIVPTVSSIVRASPNPTTSGSTVLYTVTFTEAVTGVDASDFALTTTGVTGASIQSISGSGTTYTVTVNTGSGTGTIRLDVTDDNSIIDAATNPLGGATLDDGDFFGEEYDVNAAANTAPTISDIPNQSTPANTATGNINFTVGDAETAPASLTVTATSSNQTLVPDANITLGGTGASRTINITPATNQTGTSTITVTVSDGTTTTSDTFVLTVTAANTAPTISDTTDQNGTVGTPIVIPFTVGDAETPPANLTVTATSSNTTVAPNPTITDNGGGNRSLNISPSAPGQTTITVTVTDAGGLTATDTFILTVTAAGPTIRNVDDDGMASDTDCDAANTAFTTIQSAVNAANAGDTIRVCPGTYAEQLNINKDLTLLGPNEAVNPNTGTRTAEAIIVPTSSDPLNPSFAGPIVVNLAADGITFKGFTVDGDNPSLTSGIVFNGADVDAEFGIYGTETANPDAVITNNIVRNIGEIAVWITSNSQGGAKNANSLISNNKVDNVLGNFGQGVRISDDAWLSVLNNVVTRVRVGITIENYSGNTTTHPASVIGNNNVSSFRIGIRHNLHYVYGAPGFTISNNTVTPYVPSVLPPQVTTLPTAYQGIRVESIQQTVNVTVSNNTLTGNRAALTAAGYTRNEGLMVTNSSNASPNIVFDGNSVTDFIRGAFNEDTPSVPTFTCNNFLGNTTGIYISAGAANGLIANNNNIVGNGFGLQNDGPTLVNAENNYWGAADGPGPVGPGSGDKVSTNVDFLPFLTAPSSCAPAIAPATRVVDDDGMASATDCNAADAASTTIQGAVNAANPGDTIKVCPGIYTENVNVNKQLTILGPNAGVDPNTGTRGEEAIVRTAVSNPVDATNCAFITNSAIVTLSVAGITFNGFTLDGDNPNLTSTFNFNGANIDAYSGVYSAPTVADNANQTVTNNIVKNMGEFGIFLNGTGGGGPRTGNSTLSNNKVDNVVGACFGQGIRIDDGAFANIEDNVATQVFSGIVVENFFTNTTPAPVVDSNRITAFGYAIYHNLHYAYSTNGFTYSNNTINSYVQVNGNFDKFRGIMLESIIGLVPVTLTNNTITPDSASLVAGGYTRVDGIYITNTSTDSPNILVTLNRISNALRGISHVAPAVPTVTCNNITNNDVGVYVGTDTQFGGTPSSSTNGINVNQNNIVGNPTFGVQNDTAVVTNAENNYWGAPDGPGPVGPGSGDKVTANVDFTPFLTTLSSCAPIPATLVVDDDGFASAADCNDPTTAASTTIQEAVNAAITGDTIKVCPGTYPELVSVNKTLTINGARSGVDARDVSRDGLPATESVVTGTNGSSSFYVTANDVTIDGFTVQNSSNQNPFGAAIALESVTSGTTLLNNIIQNNFFGVFLANNNAGNQTVIQRNLFRNANLPELDNGSGVVSNPSVSGGSIANVLIDNNTFTGFDGAAVNLNLPMPGTQSAITVSNNTISGNGNGIILTNVVNSTVTGNRVANSTGSQVFITRSSGLNINCNTITGGANRGIRVGDTGNSAIALNNNNITGNPTAGLEVETGSYTGTLNAENNFWGSATGPTIASNPGGTGDRIIDPDSVVDYTPFLTAASTCAPVLPTPVRDCGAIVPPYNVVTEFSLASNPNCEFSYGNTTDSNRDSAFNLYAFGTADVPVAGIDRWHRDNPDPDLVPAVFRNRNAATTTYFSIQHPPDELNIHPGQLGERSVVRFTAPAAGMYQIDGRFTGIDTNGTTTDVLIVRRLANNAPSTELFAGNVNGFGDTEPFLFNVTLAAGEIVDFSVGFGSNASYGSDSTGLSATISPFGAQGIEGDISPRPNDPENPNPGQLGDGAVNSGDVTQIRRYILGIDTPDFVTTNEFQRADTAPFATRGDGEINSGDLTQIRRYALNIEPPTPAAGPTMPTATPPPAQIAGKSGGQTESENLAPTATRTLTVVRTSLVGNTLTVGLVLNTDGSKAGANALNADINYDPAVLSNPTNVQVVDGSTGTNGRGSGGTLANVDGFAQPPSGMLNRFRVLADLPASGGGQTFGLGAQTILTIDFTVAANPPATTQLSLTSIFVSSVTGSSLPTSTTSATVLVGPTAANANIGGRVLRVDGRGVGNAQVELSDQSGNVRRVRTNAFGYYSFTDIAAGETYIISVRHKQHEFAPQVIFAGENLSDVNFIASP